MWTIYWNKVEFAILLLLMLSTDPCSTISTFVEPESRLIEVYQDGAITCLDVSTNIATPVVWSTTATSANISDQSDLALSAFRLSELFLTSVDSGYCGQYTCTFTDSSMNGTVSITVDPIFEESLSGDMVHVESPELAITYTCTINGSAGNAVDIEWSGPAVQTQPMVVEISDGIFTSNLTLTNVTMFFSGVYQCTARYSNILCTSDISSNTRLDVIAPPEILAQTQSPYIVDRGRFISLLFNFVAHPSFTDVQCSGPSGEEVIFFRIDDDAVFQIRIRIEISSVNFIHGGMYSCVANNIAGNISAMVLLIVRPIVEPQQVLALNGDNTTLMCLAQSIPEPLYIWEKFVDSNDSDSIPDEFTSALSLSGENPIITDTFLNFEPIRHGDEGVYRCVITIIDGTQEVSSQSDGIILTVSPKGSVQVEVMNNIVLFDPNEAASVNCSASGGPDNTYMWFLDGQVIEGRITESLNLNQVEGGSYTCQVRNAAGSENASIVLTEAPHDVAVSSNVEFNIAPLGGNAILQCSAKGGPNNTFEWQKDGIILSNETGDTLNLYGISPAAGGFYNCTVSNAAGNDSASIAIIVSPEGSVEIIPMTINGNHSGNATFNCFAMGSPQNIFSWIKVRDNTVIANGSELTLVDLMASDGGQYECLVENPAGRGNSTVTLNVSPLVTEHPQDQNVTIFEDNIMLTCTANGFPPPTITWFLNNTLEVNSSFITAETNIYTTRSTFTKSTIVNTDSGTYFCRAAIDGYGDINSDTVTVLVQDIPERPQNITVLDIQSRSIVLSWIKPHDNNAPILGYFIYYEQPSFIGEETITFLTTDEVASLTELFPGVAYNFTVIAYNSIGNSTKSDSIQLRTLDEAPANSPQNVTSLSLSSTIILVTWEEVPPIDRNGIITTYEVLYDPLESFGQLTHGVQNTTFLFLSLVDLHPFVNYNISVRAYTSVGNGPYSDGILERTLEDRPGMPLNVSAVANSSSEIIVYWEEVPAINKNGIILFYEVLFCRTLNCSQTQSLTTIDSATFTLSVNNLEQLTEYNITVRAYTGIGAGEESTPALVVMTLVKEPVITAVLPLDTVSIRGENLTLRCLTIGSFVDSYLWEKNGNILGNSDTLDIIADASFGGIYTCTVSNDAGSDSSTTTLYVAPYIDTPLDKQTFTANGSNVDISCDATGFPTPTVSWVDTQGFEVSNTSQLQFSPVVFGDEGQYRCVATTEINGTNFTAMDETTLIVSPEGSVAVSPLDIISSLGDTVTFVCTAMGGPGISFEWLLNGTFIGNDSVLNLETVNASYGGNYTCTVSNTAGTDSASTILYVAPYIVTPLDEQILTANGSYVNINCESTGFPHPTVTWVDMLGLEVSSTSQLQFNPIMFGDEGLYRCIASTVINTTNFTAMDTTTLSVSPEGSATVSPLNTISGLGDNVTLICSAMGGPGNLFLWEMNGYTIASDAIVDLVAINASYGGNYTCTVINAAGTDSASTTLYVAPYIVTPLEEEILTPNGSNVNINCVTAGFPAPSVKWVDALDFEVSSSSQLEFSPVMFGDEGLYRCVASTEIDGNNITAVNETTLIVSPYGSAAVSPLDVTSSLGDTVTLVCTALGGPDNFFLWEMDGNFIGNESLLHLVAIDASYGGNYICTVSNAAGTDSASTTLYVAPYIVTPLEEQTLTASGSVVNISCDATGFPTPTVNWVDRLEMAVSSSSQLVFDPVIFGDEGLYRCVATTEINKFNYTTTDNTTLIVSPEGSAAVSQDIISSVGDNVTILCTTMGGPGNSFLWELNGNVVGADNMVNLVAIDASHGGNYTCTVSNAAGTDSASTILYVAPYIVTPLEEQTLTASGSTVNISCDATGFPTPNVKWVNDLGLEVSSSSQLEFSPVIFGDEGVYLCVAFTEINGTNFTVTNQTTLIVSPEGSVVVSPLDVISNLNDNITLVCTAMGGPGISFQWELNGTIIRNDNVVNLGVIDASYGGNYTCIVSNAAGTDSVSTTLYVAPYIVTRLEKQTLTAFGSGVNINCVTAGFPSPSVKWVDNLGLEVSTSSQLEFNPVLFGDEGVYLCVASAVINGTNFTATDETTLAVSPEGSAVVSPLDIVSSLGDSVTYICTAMGGPDISYQWEINGTIVGNDSVLYLVAIDASYGGNYTCTVSNVAGTDSASTTLYVAPYIVTPLEEQTPTVNGSNVNISCGAAGFPVPTVNWEDNLGSEVSDTSQLDFSPAIFGDEGVYLCVAFTEINGTNFTAMDETTLIVSPKGSAVLSPLNFISNFGDNVSLVCTAMGGPGISFQWEIDGTIVGNDTVLDLVAIDASYGGNYTCIVSNSAGTDSVSTTLYVAPYIVTPLDEEILTVNESNVDISCEASGFPTPNVNWENMLGLEVSSTPQLEFSPVIFGDEGVYHCIASSEIKGTQFTSRNETTLIISPKGSARVYPTSINGSHDSNVTFNCFAMGGPQNVFSWKKTGGDNIITNDAILTLTSITSTDGGEYQCSVRNRAGEDNITVTLNVSPIVTHHPYPQNVTNFEGMINLNCTATGFPSPTITWFHNNTLEDNVFSLTQAINGYTTRSVFTKSMAETNDSGVYFCRSTVDGYDDVDSDSVTVLVQDIPEQPQNLTALDIQSRSVVLSWIEPHDNNAPIQGFFVIYKQPSFAGGVKTVHRVLDLLVIVHELLPGVTYNFTVIAYNNIGNSTESLTFPLRTLEEAPSNSPQNVTSVSLSSTSIQVIWGEVPLIDRNGEIILYEVHYEPQQDSSRLRIPSQTENTTSISLLLFDLQPFVVYAISVRAYTSVGHGPYSDVSFVTTQEDAPSAPTNITLINITSSYAIISWRPPEFPNGIIQGYIVSLTGRSGESLSNISTVEMSVNITNLNPFMPYWVVVFAETVEIGEGSANFSFRTLEAVPSPVQNLMASFNSTHITVKWDPPATPNGIVNYTVVIEERNLLTNDLVLIFTQNVTELELLVEYAVEAYSEYTTNVTSQTSVGIGVTQRVTIQTPEEAPSPPTNITVNKIASTYAIINWGAPEFPNGIIRGYTVSVTDSSNHLQYNISTTEMTANITGLSPFMQYLVVVFAETVDIGEMSVNVSFRTQEDIPSAVQDVMASFNGTYVIITWSPPISPNGVLSYLIDIHKRDLLTQQTNIILSALVVTELKFLINNPIAFSEYTVDVTSQTNAGIGVTQTAMLQTPEGAPSVPQNLTESFNNTHIIVMWDPPATPNGIVSYRIKIEERNLLSDESVVIYYVQNVTELELMVEYTVEAYSQYTVSVTSQTSAGIGETQTETIQTPEEAPSAPTNVTVIEIASTYAVIYWNPPEFPNGIIRRYNVSLIENGGNSVFNVSTTELLANVTGLSPFTHYWVAVFAETVIDGEKSANFSFRTSEESTFISISVQPNVAIDVGQNATISCVDTGSITPVNWSTTALLADLSNRHAFVTSESVRASELHLTDVDSGYCGTYTCTFINSDSFGSIDITIIPTFEESLIGHMVYFESPDLEVRFTCTVNGGAGGIVNIVWSGPAVETQPTVVETSNGIFTSNLILTDITMFYSGIYQCTAGYSNNLCTGNISSNMRIDVIAPPSIVFQTQSPIIVDRGVNVSLIFQFLAHPSFTAIQCRGPNGDLKMNTSSITFGRVDNNATFQITMFITISLVNYTHGGMYSCVANNSAGDFEATILLIIRPVVEPEQVLTRKDDDVTLMCLAQSIPELLYTWEISLMTGDSGSGSFLDVFSTFEPGSGENLMTTQPFLDFKPVQYGDGGLYRCVISINGMWQVSSDKILFAVSPEGSVEVEVLNKAVLFEPNEPASLTCNADGGPNNTYMWFLDGEAIEGRITDTLNLNQVEGGNYTCQVRNAAGSENASIIVTEAPHAVVVSLNIKFNVASIGDSVTLLCTNGGGPSNAYEWSKGGRILNNEGDNTLMLNRIDITSGGNYTCTVSNAAGMDSTTTVLYIAPYIVTPLEEQTDTFNGSYVNISCDADGFPRPTVKWVNVTGMEVSNTSLLEFNPVVVGHEGGYRCIATLNVNDTDFTATDETILSVASPTCRYEELSINDTTFKWPETNGGSDASFTCPNNPSFTVSRRCIPGGQWGIFDEAGCGVLTQVFRDISASSQNITNETLVETVEELSTFVQEAEERPVEQNTENLDNIANVLVNVATFVNESDMEINITVVKSVVEVLNSLTQWTPTMVMANVSSRIVMSFETVASTYTRQIPANTTVMIKTPFVTVTAENTAARTLQVAGRNLAFNDDATTSDDIDEVIPGQLSPRQEAAISLPASLFERIDDQENVGVFFAFYETATLFPVSGGNTDSNATIQTQVGSQIVAATVDSNQDLSNLENPVTIVFRLQLNSTSEFLAPGSEMCVSWDFSLQDWTPRGCVTSVEQGEIITCTCNHLTNFAVLVDICLRQKDCEPSKVEFLLTYISYIGMPISIICLILTVLTLIIFKKLRQKDISKYHIQLSLSLLLMLVVAFVVVVLSAENVAPLYGGCMLMSILVHYFSLVSVMFMAAEALLMFRKLATPFNKITSRYNIIVSITCWCIPLVPVLIPLTVDLIGGNDPGNDIIIRREDKLSFCFLSHVGAFWGAFLAPLLAIMLFNVALFICISVVLIRHVRRRTLRKVESSNHKAIFRTSLSIFGLMCLFGLTWLFAVLTFSASGLREAFQVLFTLFNSLQGAFIFVFTCVLSADAREGWKSVFTFRRFDHTKLSHYSSYKPNTSSTGTSTVRSGLFFLNPLLKIKRKRKRTEDSLIMRTFSISAALPEDENDDLFDESDSEIEYQLQIKPKALSLGANTNSVNIAMDVVASPIKKESEFNIISGEDIESSVTMFVNEGFIDVTESMQLMEQDDTQSVETISTEKPDLDNNMRAPSTSMTASDSEEDFDYTFFETDSEQEYQLQIKPNVQSANRDSLDNPIEVIAITKKPTPGEEVESSVAVYVNTAQSKQLLAPNHKKSWRLIK